MVHSVRSEMDAFWRAYREVCSDEGTLPEATYPAWAFGDSPRMANRLGALVVRGEKTATCSLLWSYEVEGEALPREGAREIILDGEGRPMCVVETGQVDIRPFNAVDEEFARAEGEGDRTLAYWRDAHWRFFTRECERIGREPDETMPLVCERFRVIFPVPEGP